MRLDCAHRRSDLTLLEILVALCLLLAGHKALVPGLLPGTGLVQRGVQELVHRHGLPMGRFFWLPLRGRFSPLMRLSGRNPEKSMCNEIAVQMYWDIDFSGFWGGCNPSCWTPLLAVGSAKP